MSDETMPEATLASGPTETTTNPPAFARDDSANKSAGASTESATESVRRDGEAPTGSGGLDPSGAPKRRRRRGSRGGRNRRKPGTGGGAANGDLGAVGSLAVGDPAGDEDDDEINLGHDYNDAAADRGLTTDDVAEVALEDAGLTHTARPRV